MSDAVVYLGPTLDRGTARSWLNATYLPPIKRGDLARLPPGIETVGIIDGVFHQSLAVSPKEIVDLLHRGVRVYGASSVGALRAVESHSYGMIGVGAIFAMYMDGEIDADDEVAVAYDPSTNRAVSESLVNIRFALKIATEQGVIPREEADQIISTMRDIYFPLRSWQLVVSMSPAIGPFLKDERFDQKRDDAILLLRKISDQNSR